MNTADLYCRLAADCGAVALACLKPQDFADASALEAKFAAWEKAGNEGLFAYLDRKHEIFCHPFATRPWARSLLCLTFLPRPWPENPLYSLPAPRPGRPAARLAAYYLNEDYHRTGHAILHDLRLALSSYFPAQASEDIHWEPCVDSGNVWEKFCCVMGGLGGFGRNSLLRSAAFGSRCHLAAVCTSLDLPRHVLVPEDTGCGPCRRCLQACPSGVLNLDGQPDFRRCCSYLSGEKSGPLTWEEQVLLNGRLLGCSCCTAACPAPALPPPQDLLADAEDILRLPTAALARMLKGTAAEHPGPVKLKRNAAAALGSQWPPETRAARQQELLALTASDTIRQTIACWPSL